MLTLPCSAAVWSDDEWLKRFSGKTLEENTEEGGTEAPKAETQEVGMDGAGCALLSALEWGMATWDLDATSFGNQE